MKRWQSDFAKINKTENFEEKYEQTTTLSTSCLSRQKGKTYLDFYLTRSYFLGVAKLKGSPKQNMFNHTVILE